MNPTPQSSLGEREAVEARRQTETARVVVVDDNQLRASALAAALKGASDTIVVVTGPDNRAVRHELFPADLVLLALGGRQVSALATGAEAVQRNPYAEVIFYCDDPDAPEVSAAAVLGITRIVPAQSMAAWLARAGGCSRVAPICVGGGRDHRDRAGAADAGDLRAGRRAPAAADGRDAFSRELHPLPADPERKPARGGAPGRRPLPDHVRDDPQARHLDEVVSSAPRRARARVRWRRSRPLRAASPCVPSALASLTEIVGRRLVAPFLLAAAERLRGGRSPFRPPRAADAPAGAPPAPPPRRRAAGVTTCARWRSSASTAVRVASRSRSAEPPHRLRLGRGRGRRRRRARRHLGRARLDRARGEARRLDLRAAHEPRPPRRAPAQPGAPRRHADRAACKARNWTLNLAGRDPTLDRDGRHLRADARPSLPDRTVPDRGGNGRHLRRQEARPRRVRKGGRAQAAAPRVHRAARVPRSVFSRGEDLRHARSRQHRPRLRSGRVGRIAVHRHGVRARRRPAHIIRRAKLRRRELSPAAALHITLEVLAGLSYAHNRRTQAGASMAIIHRDVSPSNILCSVQGEVKLSDFGIAKAATHSSAFYRVRGKVGYMSPEQARSQPIDHRTDLYSVAVCLYEALTAERLFVGDLSTPADVIYAQTIVPPSQKRKGLPTALDVVLSTALSAESRRSLPGLGGVRRTRSGRSPTATACSIRRLSWGSTCDTSSERLRRSG